MYNIHGGGFNAGSNAFGTGEAAGLLARGVMVISIGYRLGIRGFLYTPEAQDGAHANWGLLDQTAAMKWSQGFAPHFGGDIGRATISGCSAGGEAVFWHYVEEGLGSWPYFQRANAMGMGMNTGGGVEMKTEHWNQILQAAGCGDIECLRQLPDSKLVELAEVGDHGGWYMHSYKPVLAYTWGPVVDNVHITAEAVTKFEQEKMRPTTPLAWSYGRDETSGWGGDYLTQLRRAIPDQEQAIADAQDRDRELEAPG